MKDQPHAPSSSDQLKAAVLSEALPYMRRHNGKTIVVKYGGPALGGAALGDSFARGIVLLKQGGVHPIVVHGGGPRSGPRLGGGQIKAEFVDRVWVTART